MVGWSNGSPSLIWQTHTGSGAAAIVAKIASL
jgi:hypothetical protein